MLERNCSLLGLSTSQCWNCNILFLQNFFIGHQTKCGVYSCAAYEEFSFNIPDDQISKKSEDCTYCRSCQFCFSTNEIWPKSKFAGRWKCPGYLAAPTTISDVSPEGLDLDILFDVSLKDLEDLFDVRLGEHCHFNCFSQEISSSNLTSTSIVRYCC